MPNPTMEFESTLRQKTRDCKQLFQRCIGITDMDEGDWVEQKSAEFNWWASGLNADKVGPGSLDSRLSLRPDVIDVLADLLDALVMALSKCEKMASISEPSPSDALTQEESPEASGASFQSLAPDDVDRPPSPWSDMSDSTGSQSKSPTDGDSINQVRDLYQEQKFYIETNLEILIRIHAAIKKSGHKFRNQRADDDLMRAEAQYQVQKARLGEHAVLYGGDPSVGEHERFRRFLTRIVLQNGYKEGLIRQVDHNIHLFIETHGPKSEDHSYLISQKKLLAVFKAYLYDPARLTPIQLRLINANVVRRNRLIHGGNVDKTQTRSRQDQDQPQFLQQSSVTRDGAVQQSYALEQTVDHTEPVLTAPLPQTPPILRTKSRKSFVSQAATGLESNFSITAALSPLKATKSAATKMSARVANIDYPKCPASQGPFPCPYCPSILSHAYTRRNKWRAHVAQDLCPYVCLFVDCESPNDMYTSTYEWMTHMARCHSTMEWVCTECSKHSSSRVSNSSMVSFNNPTYLKEHILALHPHMEHSEMDLLVQASKRSAGIQRVECPLCRPGLVTDITGGEEDEDLVHPRNCNQDIGLIQLEEDEHIATHIHEFSLHAFPWPDESNTETNPGGSLSRSAPSSRQEITFQPSGHMEPIPDEESDLYQRREILENVQYAKLELGCLAYTNPQDNTSDFIKRRFDLIENEATLLLDRLDHEAFLFALNECRITISRIHEPALSPGAYSKQSELFSELQEYQDRLISILNEAKANSTPNEAAMKRQTPPSPSTSITDVTIDNSSKPHDADNHSSQLGLGEKDFSREKEVAREVKTQIASLKSYDEEFTQEMDIGVYLEYISDERLIHMPLKGSLWDRVLTVAQYFGSQIWSFGEIVDISSSEGFGLASAALTACQVFLEFGHDLVNALLPAFAAFNDMAILLSKMIQIRDVDTMPSDVKCGISNIFCDVVQLVGHIAVDYMRKVESLKGGQASTISFDATFGKQVNQIWHSKNAIYNDIWTLKLQNKVSISPESMRQRLHQPSMESLIPQTMYDDILLQRSEGTCYWIESHLWPFFKGPEKMFSVTGLPGCGKSVLADWTRDRLSHRFNHRSYTVLTYNFPHDSAIELTALACVKGLLFQLLEYSVGDVDLYEQVSKALSAYPEVEDQTSLEKALWGALGNGLKSAESERSPLVIITDGCDDIYGGEKSVIEFYNHLRHCVSGLSHTRVITFSRHLAVLTEGCKHLEITLQNIQQDIEVHFRQALSHSSPYRDITHVAQQHLVEELAVKSQGNFLWAFLVGRILSREATKDALLDSPTKFSSDIFKVLYEVVTQIDLDEGRVLRHLLMLGIEKPLAIHDAAKILCKDPNTAIATKPSEVFKLLPEEFKDIFIIRGLKLHFRHAVVRLYFMRGSS